MRCAMMALALTLSTACVFTEGTDTDPGSTNTGSWTTVSGPCEGYRTETIFVDGDTHHVGCGSDLGLFTSSSSTGAFSSMSGLEDFHVYEIAESPDGALWAAGDAYGDETLIYELGSGLTSVLEYDGASMRFSAAENLVVHDGVVYTDSLTGNYWAHSADDGESWTEEYLSSYQIMDLHSGDGELYAVGSTISQPPTVFHFADGDWSAIELDAPDGALEGLTWTGERWVAVGVDEGTELAAMFTCSSGCTDAGAWSPVDITAQDDTVAKLWSVHAAGDHVIAVGERYPQSLGGAVLISDDAGATWTVADVEAGLLTVAWSYGDGTYTAAGEDTWWITTH